MVKCRERHGATMKIVSKKQLDQLEERLLRGNQVKEIDGKLAEQFLMVDLYSGFPSLFERTNHT